MQYCRWGRIKELYECLNILGVNISLICTHKVLGDLDIVFDILAHVHSMSNADHLSNLSNEDQ